MGDPYFGCGEQDLIPRTVTSVLVWCAGKERSDLEECLELENHPKIFEILLTASFLPETVLDECTVIWKYFHPHAAFFKKRELLGIRGHLSFVRVM